MLLRPVNLAYSKIQHSEAENMPMPDFLLCTTNICHTVIKWYENLSKELNIPSLMFDTPFNTPMRFRTTTPSI